MRVGISRVAGAGDLPLPAYGTAGAAGADLHAAVPGELTLQALQRATVPTGVCLDIPVGFEGQVRPRSGLAARLGLGMVNAPGTIDSDYRGEVMVLLINLGSEPITLRRGDRIAQIVFAPVVRAEWDELGDGPLPPTVRGAGGLGHTGLRPVGEKDNGAAADN